MRVLLVVVVAAAVVLSGVLGKSVSGLECDIVEAVRRAGGWVNPAIKVEESETGGRVLVTTQPLGGKARLMEVPGSAMLGVDMAYRSPLGPVLMSIEGLPDAQALALYLLFVKGYPDADPAVKHVHRCHVAVLPQAQDMDVPILWSQDELDAMVASQRATQFQRDLDLAFEVWERVGPLVHAGVAELGLTGPDPSSVFTIDGFRWGMAIVSSRVFGVDRKDVDPATGKVSKYTARVLVPVVDMANSDAHTRVNTVEKVGPRGDLRLWTTRRVRSGAALSVFYARNPISNGQLLHNYGFLLPRTVVMDHKAGVPCTVGAQLELSGFSPLLVPTKTGFRINPLVIDQVGEHRLRAELGVQRESYLANLSDNAELETEITDPIRKRRLALASALMEEELAIVETALLELPHPILAGAAPSDEL